MPIYLVRNYLVVLAITAHSQNPYGPRQSINMSNLGLWRHAEAVIWALLEHVKNHSAVIGYQIDNEIKDYGTAEWAVQRLFVQHMQQEFPSLEALTKRMSWTARATVLTTEKIFRRPWAPPTPFWAVSPAGFSTNS